MNRRQIWMCLLLAGVVAGAASLPLLRNPAVRSVFSGPREVLRIGYTGAYLKDRDAFAALILEYQRLHPEVEILHQFVPGRVFSVWSRTQLVGEKAPDLMQIEYMTDELIARHFTSLDPHLNRPNPYNRGTAYEDVAWRETFYDLLDNRVARRESLGGFYGVGMFRGSVRMICNLDLLQAITGSEAPLETYGQYWEFFQQVADYNRKHGTSISPIAASSWQGRWMVESAIVLQTQDPMLANDLNRDLLPQPREALMGYLNGGWSFRDESIRLGLESGRRLTLGMQAGFLQADGDLPVYLLAQDQAVFMAAFSFDLDKILQGTDRRLGVFDTPVPGPADAPYASRYRGRGSEAALVTTFHLGVTRQSRHSERAIDFLQFISSVAGNQLYCDVNAAIPAVRGVTVRDVVKGFSPKEGGTLSGLWPLRGLTEVTDYVWRNLHLLVSAQGGVEPFIREMEANYAQNATRDLELLERAARIQASFQDVLTIAMMRLPHTEINADRLDRLILAQTQGEIERRQIRATLKLRKPQSQP